MKKDQQNLDTWHGAEGRAQPPKRTGRHNNLNPMTHGIWANQCLDDEERELFREIIERLQNDFVFNKSSDFLARQGHGCSRHHPRGRPSSRLLRAHGP